MTNCPCNSGKQFDECCGPVLENQSAKSALTLMRSRFTAYSTGNAEYLHHTTHHNTRAAHKLNDIKEWSQENTWTKLEIINVEHGNINDTRGIVEFKAHFTDKKQKEQVHHERSTFLKEGLQWFYLDGIMNPPTTDSNKKVSRNDPCPCGSGKKHKKCCL